MLTEKELQEIEARADVATREGWEYQLDDSVRDIPALLAEVRRLREENARLQDEVLDWQGDRPWRGRD